MLMQRRMKASISPSWNSSLSLPRHGGQLELRGQRRGIAMAWARGGKHPQEDLQTPWLSLRTFPGHRLIHPKD
jgi:hypothetical protein